MRPKIGRTSREEKTCMISRCLVIVALNMIASGCPRTPQPTGTVTSTIAPFHLAQQPMHFTLACTVTGQLPNMRIDPFIPTNPPCGINTFTVFGQTLNVPMVAILGQHGDDSPSRVRVDVTISPSIIRGPLPRKTRRIIAPPPLATHSQSPHRFREPMLGLWTSKRIRSCIL